MYVSKRFYRVFLAVYSLFIRAGGEGMVLRGEEPSAGKVVRKVRAKHKE